MEDIFKNHSITFNERKVFERVLHLFGSFGTCSVGSVNLQVQAEWDIVDIGYSDMIIKFNSEDAVKEFEDVIIWNHVMQTDYTATSSWGDEWIS